MNVIYARYFTCYYYYFIFIISSLFKVDLNLTYKKPIIKVNNNNVHISVNKRPNNNDNNKIKYFVIR